MSLWRAILIRRGSVLLLVLWMLILLGVVGLSYTSSVRTQVHAMRSTRGHVEALWAARAGIERARVELSLADLGDLRYDDPLFDDAEAFAGRPVGPALYSLIVPRFDPDETPVFGLVDECSRINLNTADEDFLHGLPAISDEMADCLLDWRDGDGDVRPAGAENDYYADLEAPYLPRNGALISLRELLRVRGWEPVWRQVWPDPYDRFRGTQGRERSPLDPEDARLLMRLLTIWSTDDNIAPDGEARMDLAGVTAEQMRGRISDLTEEEAGAIVKWRDDNQYEKTTDLFEVRAVEEDDNNRSGDRNSENDSGDGQSRVGRNDGANDDRGSRGDREDNDSERGGENRSGNDRNNRTNQSTGEKVFDLGRVGQIIDYFSASGGGDNGGGSQNGQRPGRINLNTAPREALLSVPGMTETLADALLNQREGGTVTATGAALAQVNRMDEETFTQLYPYLTARSSRFHVWSRGIEPDSGAAVTVEAVLAASTGGEVSIVYWREE
jgi:DNA uptake protein ComE-like DNA-binding protein